jgi:ketosteroid isomerase-like protein
MDTMELLRNGLEGFNRQDMAALKAVLASDVNWFAEPPSDAFCPDRDHVIAQLGRVAAQGERFELDQSVQTGDGVAVATRDADGGLWWLVFTVHDGKVVRMDDRSTRESALQTIGYG